MVDYTSRFTGRAGVYSISRPGYPKKVLEILKTEVDLTPAATVADVGSGTGLLARLFVENGNRVYGIEPNDEMRSFAEEAFEGYSNFVSVKGKAEATGLSPSSIDLIVSGQAFHWFDPQQSKLEFRRILKDGKAVCIVYNNRSKDDPFMKEYDRIVKKYGTNRATTPEITNTYLSEWFRPRTYREFTLQNEQQLDLDGLLGRMLSASYMPSKEETVKFSALKKEVTSLFEQYENHGIVTMIYRTEISLGQV